MKYLSHYLPKTLCLVLLMSSILFSPAALTLGNKDNNTNLQSSSTSNLSDLASALGEPEEEFLTVDEAYKLSVRDDGAQLVAEWVIAEKYYLYGEQFKFSANGSTIDAERAPGKVSYDAIFEKDVEKYYHFARVTIDKTQLPKDQGFALQVGYQGCADAGLCYPPEKKSFFISADFSTITASHGISKDQQTTAIDTPSNSAPTPFSWGLTLSMILLAILGGSILNLMPCVFPVLSFKALSLVENCLLYTSPSPRDRG